MSAVAIAVVRRNSKKKTRPLPHEIKYPTEATEPLKSFKLHKITEL